MKTALALLAFCALMVGAALANPSCASRPNLAIYHVGQHVKLLANHDDPDAAFIFCTSLQKMLDNENNSDIGNCQTERRAVGQTFIIDSCTVYSRPGASDFDMGAYAVYHLHNASLSGWTTNEELATSKVW